MPPFYIVPAGQSSPFAGLGGKKAAQAPTCFRCRAMKQNDVIQYFNYVNPSAQCRSHASPARLTGMKDCSIRLITRVNLLTHPMPDGIINTVS